MKLEIFVFCLFLLSVNCSTVLTDDKKDECENKEPSEKKDCNSIYDDDLINAGYHCCYIYFKYDKEIESVKTKEIKYCESYNKTRYDAIADDWKTVKKEAEQGAKDNNNKLKKAKIECQSSFLKFGFFGLIATLLL